MKKLIQEYFDSELIDNLDIEYVLDNADCADDISDGLIELISQEEIIYYANAMEYLSENDASLSESTALAVDCGFELADINSELLATLLMQQNFHELASGIDYDALFKEIKELNQKRGRLKMKTLILTAILATTVSTTAQPFELNNKGTLRWKVVTQCESVTKCMGIYASAKAKGLNSSVKIGKKKNRVTVQFKASCDSSCLANPSQFIASQ